MGRAEDALGRLLPCPLLPCPLLPAAAAALVDGPPPAPLLPDLPLPLLIGCLPCDTSAVPRARHDALYPCVMDI
jgi:hypothetical protein